MSSRYIKFDRNFVSGNANNDREFLAHQIPSRSQTKSNCIDFVKKLPLFQGLTDDQKISILNEGQVLHYAEGRYLFRHGDSLRSFYIICDGVIKISYVSPEGENRVTDILTSGHSICKAEIFQLDKNHSANAIIVKDAEVMKFPKSWLIENVKKYDVFALNLLVAISYELSNIRMEVEQQAQMSSMQLLMCFFKKLCFFYNFDPAGFELPYSKSLIAARLGVKSETFSRMLAKLKEYGIIIEGSHVSIKDMKVIQKDVCSACPIEEDCLARKFFGKKSHNKFSSFDYDPYFKFRKKN